MKPDPIYTRVIFRKWPASQGGGIIALFPTLPHDNAGDYCMSYERIGQHGGADPGLVARTKPARPAEYAALARELRALGYQLHITHRFTDRLHQQRRDAARSARGS